MTTGIEALEKELAELLRQQGFAEMSDDRYYSSGRKREDDREIAKVRARIEDALGYQRVQNEKEARYQYEKEKRSIP